MTFIGTDYIVLHNTDREGGVHQWATSFQPGDPISMVTDAWTWLGEVESINTATATFPQQLVDTFVASGLTLIRPTMFPAQVPPTDAVVEVGEPPSGLVLTLHGGLPEWLPPQGGSGGSGPVALDDLTDVDVHLSATGMMLTKQIDGSWKGQNFSGKPLNWLSDVDTRTIDADGNLVPADQTPAGHVLGTSGPGAWEPLPLAYIEEQIVGPLQAEIGDPHIVAAHTDLVGYIAEIEERLSAVEGTETPPVATDHLFVDKYGGSFIRVSAGTLTGSTTVDLALATTPGPGGEVYAALGDIPGQSAVWADFGGTLGHMKTAQGTDVLGAALKEWIRKGTVLTVHKDVTDPAHPALVVDAITTPTTSGSNLTLGQLKNVAPSSDAAPTGMFLGVTAVGQWGPVAAPTGANPAGNATVWFWGVGDPTTQAIPADANDYYLDTATGQVWTQFQPTTDLTGGT
jgi:hypothetical protein